jgi:two-component system, chemotaxis family, sensor kinase CheA
MAIDLSRFEDSFHEEAAEHLVTMESLLLAVNIRRPDTEALDAIFRAAHSIKGGAGAFGLAALGEFTHELESAFDGVRKGEIDFTKTLIDLFLRSVDALRLHVSALRQGEKRDDASFDAMKRELAAGVAQARRIHDGLGAPIASPGHRVELALDAAEFPDRATVDALLLELSALGTLVNVDVSFAPGEGGTVSFVVETSGAIEGTRDSLRLFVADGSILKCHAGTAADVATGPGQSLPVQDDDDAFGFFAPEAPVQAAAFSDADSVRINIAKMDELVNLVGELLITQAMVTRGSDIPGGCPPALAEAIEQLQRNTGDLQRSVLSIRMLPIRHVTTRIPRLARDVSERLGKEIALELEGEDTELDKGLIEKLADPLMHLVRNAIDHGIEMPEARRAKGKPAAGRLTVRARHEGGKIMVSVSDDGAGLNRAALIDAARAAGIEVDDNAPDDAIWPLVFRPGLSTAGEVTEVSGRGVGMDVVQRNVRALGGTIDIASAAGRGATFTLRLPLTLAIIEGMSIVADGESYIVPLSAIAQSLRPGACDLRTMGGRQVLRYAGEFIPVVSLGEIFGHPIDGVAGVHVVLDIDGRRAALNADELLGLHQTVVKGLEDNYRRVDGISGATILADGRVALILDAQRLIERAGAVEARAA